MTSPAPALRTDVSVLYCDRLGVYPKLAADCWDDARDARVYAGPLPVVAHPPCGPWSKLRNMCTEESADCGLYAVTHVRAYGGVLEHPAHSTLFDHEGMPRPGGLPDAFGGRTWDLNQVSWGHPCVKPTWLYTVGVPIGVVIAGLRYGGRPTHCICTGPRQKVRLPVASKQMKRRTPIAFAQWLLDLAAQARNV